MRFKIFAIITMLVGTPLPARCQRALEDIQRNHKIVFACEALYPPFESVQDDGTIQGFDIDLGNEIAHELGVQAVFKNMEWSGVLGSLEHGLADCILSDFAVTKERKPHYGFSRPYCMAGLAIVRRRDDRRVQGDLKLKLLTFAVQDETTGLAALQNRNIATDRIHKFKRLQDALMDVRNGASDAVVADLFAELDAVKKAYSADLEVINGSFPSQPAAVATRPGETALLASINKALGRIMVDGRYGRIYEKWTGRHATTHVIAELDGGRNLGSLDVPTSEEPVIPKQDADPPRHVGAIRWDLVAPALPTLFRGARMTVFLTGISLVIGIAAGLMIALCRISAFRVLSVPALTYIEIIRGTPLLMQIYVIYFVLPAFNIRIPEIFAGVLALSLNAAAYISEIFRAGIQSVDSGQMEAAQAIGMTYIQATRWVIIPQTLRRVLPPLTNEAIALLKESSLVSVISISELMLVGSEFATRTGSPTTAYLLVAMVYLAMTLPLTWVARRLEEAWRPRSRYPVRQPLVNAQVGVVHIPE